MLRDITPDDIAGPGIPHTLRYFDGTTRNVVVTSIETPFPSGELIVSQTDPKGIITMCNEAFVRMSGYSREELLGAPHHILRHPDMPAAAFEDLWKTILSGKKWHGYVKNLRKDGGFYWVYATIVPNIRNKMITGYTSVRREPDRRKVEEYARLYAAMLLDQRSFL